MYYPTRSHAQSYTASNSQGFSRYKITDEAGNPTESHNGHVERNHLFMVQAKVHSITLEEFLAMPETKPASEFIDGEIIQKPMPKGRHSRLQGSLTTAINQATESERIALALPELRCAFGTRAIVPDVAVFTWERIPFTPDGDVPDDFELAPDWVIEILSPDQSPIKVIDNILYALRSDSRLGWLISPSEQSVLIFLPGQQSEVLKGEDRLPILPEIPLELSAEKLFDWLRFN